MPTIVQIPYIFYYPISEGGYSILLILDCCLLYSCLTLALFALTMAYPVLENLRHSTSAVAKLKKQQGMPVRSVGEICAIVFGPQAGMCDYLLPTRIK